MLLLSICPQGTYPCSNTRNCNTLTLIYLFLYLRCHITVMLYHISNTITSCMINQIRNICSIVYHAIHLVNLTESVPNTYCLKTSYKFISSYTYQSSMLNIKLIHIHTKCKSAKVYRCRGRGCLKRQPASLDSRYSAKQPATVY